MYRGSRTLSKIVRDFSPRLNTHAHMFLPIYNLIDIYQKPIFLKNFPRIQLHFPHFESTRENAGKRCPFRSLVPIHFPNEKSFVEPSDISVCCHYINCVLCRLGLSRGYSLANYKIPLTVNLFSSAFNVVMIRMSTPGSLFNFGVD